MKKIITATTILLLSASRAAAQITNPVTGNLGSNASEAASGNLFVTYFLRIWNVMITVGALAVLLYFVWGAVSWITSSGDKGKMEEARNRMFNAIVGLVLLVAAYTIIGFISMLLFGNEFNILAPKFFTSN